MLQASLYSPCILVGYGGMRQPSGERYESHTPGTDFERLSYFERQEMFYSGVKTRVRIPGRAATASSWVISAHN